MKMNSAKWVEENGAKGMKRVVVEVAVVSSVI